MNHAYHAVVWSGIKKKSFLSFKRLHGGWQFWRLILVSV